MASSYFRSSRTARLENALGLSRGEIPTSTSGCANPHPSSAVLRELAQEIPVLAKKILSSVGGLESLKASKKGQAERLVSICHQQVPRTTV
jgi:hypothetical protein